MVGTLFTAADYLHTRGAVQRHACAVCGELVVVVHAGRNVIFLDVEELIPRGLCGQCHGRGTVLEGMRGGRRRVECARCNGAGETGDPLIGRIVALSQGGRVRRFHPLIGAKTGEALHTVHECEAAAVGVAA